MFEVKEALRLWLASVAKKRIAAQLGVDPQMSAPGVELP